MQRRSRSQSCRPRKREPRKTVRMPSLCRRWLTPPKPATAAFFLAEKMESGKRKRTWQRTQSAFGFSALHFPRPSSPSSSQGLQFPGEPLAGDVQPPLDRADRRGKLPAHLQRLLPST